MTVVLLLNLVIGLVIFVYAVAIFLEWLADRKQKETVNSEKQLVLMIRVSKDNESGPLVAEQVFSTIHSIVAELSFWERLAGRNFEKVSFEIANIGRSIRFYVHIPASLRNLVEGQIYAQYPNVEIDEVTDYALPQNVEVASKVGLGQSEGREKAMVVHTGSTELNFKEVHGFANAVGAELSFTAPDFFPIKTYSQFEDKSTQMNVDPLSGITATLAKFSDPEEQACIQYVLNPISEKRGEFLQKVYESFANIKGKFSKKYYFKYWLKSSRLKRVILFPLTFLLKPRKIKP
ncbi:hypothetical protein IT411_03575, partial [Candidatus Peregrinibacteria bacterium]|nr:hypothetical protein [Candidatus Peregrinibacteria bacterium]